MNLLQDILGLVARNKKVKPIDTDVLPIGRYKTSKEILKPKPDMKTNLVSLKQLKDYMNSGLSGDNQTLSLTGNDLSISNGNTVDLSNLEISNLDISLSLVKLRPFNLLAGAGGSSSMPSSVNIINISWDGLGSGVYTLTLPNAADLTFRNIRIVTDGTLDNGARDKIHITAASGETIDGQDFFEISKRYEGISVWSDGVEWRIIQAKAH
jgi:pectate lyase